MDVSFRFFLLLPKNEDLVSDSVVNLLAVGFLKSSGQCPCEAHRDDEVLTSRKNLLHFFRAIKENTSNLLYTISRKNCRGRLPCEAHQCNEVLTSRRSFLLFYERNGVNQKKMLPKPRKIWFEPLPTQIIADFIQPL